jgi:hypothetical protein
MLAERAARRQTWEAAAQLVDELMEPPMGVNTGTIWRNTQTRLIAEKLRARAAALDDSLAALRALATAQEGHDEHM